MKKEVKIKFEVSKEGAIDYSATYKEFEGIGSEYSIHNFDDKYLEIDNPEEYVKELKGNLDSAYNLLDSDTKTIQEFIDTVQDGLFGGETYNGWLYLDDLDDFNGDEHALTMSVLLFIIAKIETYLQITGRK